MGLGTTCWSNDVFPIQIEVLVHCLAGSTNIWGPEMPQRSKRGAGPAGAGLEGDGLGIDPFGCETSNNWATLDRTVDVSHTKGVRTCSEDAEGAWSFKAWSSQWSLEAFAAHRSQRLHLRGHVKRQDHGLKQPDISQPHDHGSRDSKRSRDQIKQIVP